MVRPPSPRLLALLVVALPLVGLLIDQLVVTDAERLEHLLKDLSAAVASEDKDRFAGLVTEDFSFEGPSPVRSGDYEETFTRLADFWAQVTATELNWRDPQIDQSGPLATVESSGLVRFRYGDVLVMYRADSRLVCVRQGDAWRLRRLDIVALRRGIF